MKFLVRRASIEEYDEAEVPPCPGAYRDTYFSDDVRTIDDPKKVEFHKGTDEWWYTSGVNHRVVDGCIVRSFLEHGWFVEISSLENLVALVSKSEGSFALLTDLVRPLSKYAVGYRYPGEEARRPEARHAAKIMEEAREFIIERLKQ